MIEMVVEENKTATHRGEDRGRDNHELPEGWIIVPLDELCDIYDSERIPVNSKDREKRATGKKQNELYPYYGATGPVGWIDEYIFDGEHVLLGEDGAPFLDFSKDTAYIAQGKFWVNNHAHILIGHPSNKYLCFYLNKVDFREFVTGTTRLKLNQSQMKKIPVTVAPEQEQQRIVSKLEELFSELDKGIEFFKTAREQLKVYRQAVLKHAFEGKLTEGWRKKHADELEPAETLLKKIKAEREQRYQQQLDDWEQAVKAWEADGKEGRKPAKPGKSKELPPLTDAELAELPELPEGWGWERYGNICLEIRNGISTKPNDEDGEQILRISAVRPFHINLDDVRHIENKYGNYDEFRLTNNDIIFTRYNGSRRYVGVCAKFQSKESFLFPDKLIRTRLLSTTFIHPDYIVFTANSGGPRKFIEKRIRTTAGQSGISGSDIKGIPIPLCSDSEQIQVVQQIESRLSVVEKLEQDIDDGLRQAETLRQSLLKKAFEGRLVRQDPNDEPASVLLERIKAEKAEQVKKTRCGSPLWKRGRGGDFRNVSLSPLSDANDVKYPNHQDRS